MTASYLRANLFLLIFLFNDSLITKHWLHEVPGYRIVKISVLKLMVLIAFEQLRIEVSSSYYFIWIFIEICRPPGETARTDYVMVTFRH
jgi:hypothetical protein